MNVRVETLEKAVVHLTARVAQLQALYDLLEKKLAAKTPTVKTSK